MRWACERGCGARGEKRYATSGDAAQIRDQARGISHVPIQTVARTGLTSDRLVELIGILQETLREHDRVVGA